MLTARQRMVRGYGFAIYTDGTRSFATVGDSYHDDVKCYAAANFTTDIIDGALSTDKIGNTEYRDTLALVGTDKAQAWLGV